VKFKESTMLAGICLSFFHCVAHAQLPVDTAEAYQHEQYEIEPGIMRMLALYYVNNGDYARALPALNQALLTSPDDIELKEALQVLHDKLCKDRRFELADEVEQVAKERDPESEIACEYSPIPPEVTTESGFNVDVAYRFNYDDNVAYPEENFATGEADYSHVFLADVLYNRPFGSGSDWRFFAEGHFLQSLYHQFDQFNQTRLSAVAAIGKTGENIGWRLPVEVTQDWLDGSTYRTSLVTRPGLFVQFTDDFFSHFYGRIQSDDYKIFPYPEENRSGEVYGGGIKIVAQASEQIRLHSYLEYNRYNTDGEYWQRDEIVAFVAGEYFFSENWEAGLALRYQKDDYDNVRPIFADRQKDTSKEVYLNLTYRLSETWNFRAQYSRVNHESNIAIFDYNRNVYSLMVIWRL
jgi:hypothetical protein